MFYQFIYTGFFMLFQAIKHILLLFCYQFLFIISLIREIDVYYDRKLRGMLKPNEKFSIQRELYVHMFFSFLYFIVSGPILFGVPGLFPYSILFNLAVGAIFFTCGKVLDEAFLKMWEQERMNKVD